MTPRTLLSVEAGSTLTVTAVLPPIPVTGPANSITTTTATLNGTINPDGAATSGSFVWGLTSAYGNSTPIPQLPAGLGAVAVSGSLSLLSSRTVYHYAILAANLTGTAQSADMTFETEAPPAPGSPVVTTGGATNLSVHHRHARRERQSLRVRYFRRLPVWARCQLRLDDSGRGLRIGH